jgi:hypothetical protein
MLTVDPCLSSLAGALAPAMKRSLGLTLDGWLTGKTPNLTVS